MALCLLDHLIYSTWHFEANVTQTDLIRHQNDHRTEIKTQQKSPFGPCKHAQVGYFHSLLSLMTFYLGPAWSSISQCSKSNLSHGLQPRVVFCCQLVEANSQYADSNLIFNSFFFFMGFFVRLCSFIYKSNMRKQKLQLLVRS